MQKQFHLNQLLDISINYNLINQMENKAQYQVDTHKCTWKLGDDLSKSPHIHEPFRPIPKKIYDDVLDAIGNTPLVRLNKVPQDQGIQCEILAKCEFMNMGGSVKDRIGKRMVLDAEKTGRLHPGDKIVEATSGNTGIGLALASAVKGYGITITMPEKMSTEKANVLKGLGANIIRTPTEASFDSPQSHISISQNMEKQGYVLLDQYKNPSNPIAHFDQLAEEIYYQCDGRVDAVIVGVGTGGTIAGIARKIKTLNSSIQIVGADPFGSILAIPYNLNTQAPPNKVEGIGYDFVPKTCMRECIDKWYKTDDLPSFTNSRDIIRKQGILCGGSAGSVLQAAFAYVKQMGWENDKTKRVVCIFSDGIRNYLTKFLSKQWCVQNKFLSEDELKQADHPFNGVSLSELNLPEIKSYSDLTVNQAKELFSNGAQVIPFRTGEQISSVTFAKKFLELVCLKKLQGTDSALKTKTKDYAILSNKIDVAQLTKCLERHDAVLIEQRSEDGKTLEKLWVATAKDTFKLMK